MIIGAQLSQLPYKSGANGQTLHLVVESTPLNMDEGEERPKNQVKRIL